ncbi:hypothetical protein DRJ54_08075 [Candidatus Acetothermia bacterium]|nr:MAG: hypothetical protein DRJ54_08075 [Candidatus Acetothermia bacterium]
MSSLLVSCNSVCRRYLAEGEDGLVDCSRLVHWKKEHFAAVQLDTEEVLETGLWDSRGSLDYPSIDVTLTLYA